jgi:response regulator RpfG family c-di-GMP phosphodiesterase
MKGDSVSDTTLPRILCVDDEPNLLDGLKRQLRKQYEVLTAASGAQGLELLASAGPFPVVVSDMRMPEMDGAAFLAHVREQAPDTVRMLLTGQTDIQSAISAVNDGQIFRFLTKPCAPEDLGKALGAALNQYRLIHAERELLEQTLRGSIQMLTDVLAQSNPLAFGRAIRLKRRATELANALQMKDRWPLEVAAMLSQVGCISLPAQTVEKWYGGKALTEEEQKSVSRLPLVAARFLARIPRMEPVRDILVSLERRFSEAGQSLPQATRVLRIVLDLDVLESQGIPSPMAVDMLIRREGIYDPEVLEVMARSVGTAGKANIQEVMLFEVREGMIFTEDVVTESGMLLIARGQEVTPNLMDRLQNVILNMHVKEPLKVCVPQRR